MKILSEVVSLNLIPSIICYSFAIIFIFLLFKLKIFTLQDENASQQNVPSRPVRIVLLAFLISISSAFFGLYQTYIPIVPKVSIFTTIIENIIVGGILYIIFYYLLKFLMNNDISLKVFKFRIRFGFRTKYAFFIFLILLCSSLFSIQTTTALTQQDHFIILGYSSSNTPNYVLNNNSKLVYGIESQNGKQYLVVKDLQDNGKTKLYSVCMENNTCVNLVSTFEIVYYNSTTIFIYNTHGIYNKFYYIMRYSLNLPTDKIISAKAIHYNQNSLTRISNTLFYKTPSAIYYATFNLTYNYYKSGNFLLRNDSSALGNIHLFNDISNKNITIQLANITSVQNIALTPDLSKLAITTNLNTYFYSLQYNSSVIEAKLLDNESTWYFVNFVSWSSNYSNLYYSAFNDLTNTTSLSTFNFSSSQNEKIFSISSPGPYDVHFVNLGNSYVVAEPLYNRGKLEIFSFKGSSSKLVQNLPSGNYFTSYSDSNFLTMNNKEILLTSYDASTNSLTTKIIDVENPTGLGLLNNFETILVILDIISVMVLLNRIITDNNYDASRRTTNLINFKERTV